MNDIVANIYELWGLEYLGDFSKYMYRADLYSSVFLVMFISSIIILFIYYKPLDHIQLAKKWIWALIVLALGLICSLAAYNIAVTGIDDYLFQNNIKQTQIKNSDFMTFSCIVFGWTVLLSFIWSVLFKYFSINSRKIPF